MDLDINIWFVVPVGGRGCGISIIVFVFDTITTTLFGGLVFLALTSCLVLQNKTAQLGPRVDSGTFTTSLAVEVNVIVLEDKSSLRIMAFLAKDKLLDETIEVVL